MSHFHENGSKFSNSLICNWIARRDWETLQQLHGALRCDQVRKGGYYAIVQIQIQFIANGIQELVSFYQKLNIVTDLQ